MSRKNRMIETTWVTLFFVLPIISLRALPLPTGLQRIRHLILPLCWILVPLTLLSIRKEPIRSFGYHLDHLARSLGIGLLASILILTPYFLLVSSRFGMAGFTAKQGVTFFRWFNMGIYQFSYIALPEEFFFRGYLQTRLNRIFGRPFQFLGAPFGWGLVMTALIFTLFHFLLSVNLWNAGIFFPALIFGWLREKTDSIAASTLFHALSNIALFTFQGRF